MLDVSIYPTLSYVPALTMDPLTALRSGTVNFEDRTSRNNFVDVLANEAELFCGWEKIQPLFATYGLSSWVLTESIRAYSMLVKVDGVSFQAYNPTYGEDDPSGTTTDYWNTPSPILVVGFPVVAEADFPGGSRMYNWLSLAAAITTATDFVAAVEPPIKPGYDVTLILTSRVPGSGGNLRDIRGATHTIATPAWLNGGGWHFLSRPANGQPNNRFGIQWYLDEWENFSITTNCTVDQEPGGWRDWHPFPSIKFYMWCASPHQFSLIAQQNATTPALTDTAGFRGGTKTFRVASPYQPEGHVEINCAYSFPLNQTRMQQQTLCQIGYGTGQYLGDFSNEGETGFCWAAPYNYEETDLLLVNNQPPLFSPIVTFATTDGLSRAMVGFDWDCFIVLEIIPLDTVVWEWTDASAYSGSYSNYYPYIAIVHNSEGGQASTLFQRMSPQFQYNYGNMIG